MGSKKKNAKICWTEVDDGHFILNKGDVLNVSLNSTYGENSNQDLSLQSDTFQSFIKDSVFCGQIITKPENDVKLNEGLKETIIELNPITMQLCGMQIGFPVIVSPRSDGQTSQLLALRSWPSMKVPLGKVGISEKHMALLGAQVGNPLYVAVPSENCLNAELVQLLPVSVNGKCSSFYGSNHFKSYISTVLDRKYIIDGQKIEFKYFAKLFHFKVTHVQPCSNVNNKSRTNHNKDASTSCIIEDQLSALSLSNCGSGEPLHVSTPLKHSKVLKTPVKQHLSPKRTQVYMITNKTLFEINEEDKDNQLSDEKCDPETSAISFRSIGGLRDQIQVIKDLTVLPLQSPEIFTKSGIRPIRGLLLHGPPGTGKSLLARAVATEAKSKMIFIRGTEIMSRFLGESEKQLKSIFQKAKAKSPCVVVMDELDTLCPKRETSRTDAERRIVASLVNVLDELNSASGNSRVVVIATTNRLDSVDPALRRAGRFDRELEIGIPSATDRCEIFGKLLANSNHSLSDEEIRNLADSAHGYVGADLAAVCVEAGMSAIKRLPKQSDGDSPSPCITADDVEAGLRLIPPSAMRELIVQVPQVRWSDIGGNESVKKKLKHAIEWPLKNPEAFSRLGIDPPRGLLMFGPPGCSKTLTAKALATESGLNFISIKGPELFSKFVGDSERAIRRIFAKARSAAPSIIFFDELDALAIERGSGNAVADRVLAAMLTEMDGVERRRDVIVVAATNRPDMIDKALLRPGRIDRILHVPLPDADTRREIFRIRFRKMPISDDVDMEWLVESTEMYSGAEICALCREGALAALEDDLQADHVTRRHFELALATVRPQTSRERAQMYEEYSRTLQTRIK